MTNRDLVSVRSGSGRCVGSGSGNDSGGNGSTTPGAGAGGIADDASSVKIGTRRVASIFCFAFFVAGCGETRLAQDVV